MIPVRSYLYWKRASASPAVTVNMVYRRFLVLCGFVSLFLFYSCTDGSSPLGQSSTGRAVVALSTVFPEGTTADQTADITRIRITVKRVSDDSIVAVCVTDVDPTLEVWVVDCEVEIPPDDPSVYLVTELISVSQGIETVEYSGITAGFSLTAQTAVQRVEVVQGPVANIFVTSVTLVGAGPVTEGDGLQLQAQVQMSQPGAPTLLWESADPSIATMTQGGFLQAHLPGTARISVTAGAQSDETSVVVVARPIGLAFVSQPSSVEVGEPLNPAPTVEVVDARGDRVGDYVGAVTLELQDRATVAVAAAVVATAAATAPGVVGAPQAAGLSGTTTVDAVGGLATFDGLVIPDGGLFRLFATAQGLNPAASEDFEVMLMTADIAVSKEVDKPTALEGDQVTFTVTVVNNGPATATGVTVSDPLPAGLVFVSATPSHGSYSAATGAWDVGTLTNGESATLTLVATVGQGTGDQTLENVATAPQLTEQNDDPSNNQASALVAVGRRVADIGVTKVADQAEVREGEKVVFTISVTNHGPDRAEKIVVTDRLPPGLEFVSADLGYNPSTGEWTIPSLAPGALARLTITAVVAEGFAGETLTNTATAAVLEHQEDDPSNNSGSATVVAIAPSLVGSWRATSVLQNGVEMLVGTSTQFIINLRSDGTFLESVAGDTQELFCDETTSCTDNGTWFVTGTRLFICDPGCDDEDIQYTISGNTLIVVVVDEDPVTTMVSVRLPEVVGTTELLPGDLCSDHPASAIATFEDANLDAAIRAALALGPLDDLTCSRISWLTGMDARSLGIVSLVGIQNLTNLTFVRLRFNSITDISALSGLTGLTRLGLSNNSITDISALSGLTSLTRLGLSNNSITDISALSGLTSLTRLFLSNNTITDISALSGLTSLTNLQLSFNAITDISALSGLTNLTLLPLGGNSISNISPLSGLTSLTGLFLFDNSITDISALSGLTSLVTLNLQINAGLTDIQPLLDNTGLGAGDTVDLSGTGVSCTDVAALQAKGVFVFSDPC